MLVGIAEKDGVPQIFADDAAYPQEWICLGDDGEYYLFPRDVFRGWAWKRRVDQEEVAMHLYPLSVFRAKLIRDIAVRRT